MRKTNLNILFIIFLLIGGCSSKLTDTTKIIEINKIVEEANKLIKSDGDAAEEKFKLAIEKLNPLLNEFPDDEIVKATFVRTHIFYGNYLMVESPYPPKQKYPGALKEYREALRIDPTNTEAKQNEELIVSIYSQMGREVPN